MVAEQGIITYDNNSKIINQEQINKEQFAVLQAFANYSLKELQEQNNNLLVFPKHPAIEELKSNSLYTITTKYDTKYFNTFNIMGVFRITDENQSINVEIRSRFDKEEGGQPFLTYLLAKAFNGNFIDWKIEAHKGLWNIILVLLFQHYLVKAFKQGLFKQYQWFFYNDYNFKGKMNVKEQIRQNTPFQGKIAYKTRKNTYDNPILHLVRQTLFFIRNNYPELFTEINNIEFNKACKAITETTPSWKIQNINKIIKAVQKPIRHPYFTEYEPLRKLCLQILRKEGCTIYGQGSKSEIEGVVFDGAWLWETYLAKILKELDFKHQRFKYEKEGIEVFKGDNYKLYPDFLNFNKSVVLDAKYKQLKRNPTKLQREDIHQMLSYMYLINARTGGLIYPSKEDSYTEELRLTNDEALWFNIPFIIPSKYNSKDEYIKEIRGAEKKLQNSISKIIEV